MYLKFLGALIAKGDKVWPPKLVQTRNRAGRTTQGLACTLGTPWQPAAPKTRACPFSGLRLLEGGGGCCRDEAVCKFQLTLPHCSLCIKEDNREQHTVGT